MTIAPYLRQPDRAVRALHEAAYTIQSMPTLGIDPAVVGWALRAATVCEQEANLIENSNAPALLIEALVRGADGDPYGLGVELIAAERQWRAVYAAVRQEGIRLRAALTAHYGIEFPPTAF